MDLIVKKIKLLNFRNYKCYEKEDFSNFNIFIGKNGAGKTNIIEAIQLITSLESFRNPKWNEIIKWGSENSYIESNFINENRNLNIKLDIINNKRNFYLNGKKKSISEIKGLLPSILFCPDDLKIVKGSASNRRDALDYIGTQISSTYYDLKLKYIKSIRQKNILLQQSNINLHTLDSWNENISIIGSSFINHRLNLFENFRNNLVRIWLEMVKNLVIDVVYIPSWEVDKDVEIKENCYLKEEIESKLKEKINSLKEVEVASKQTLSGPQRDEIKFYIDGYDARKYASQGQQRLITLCWKIAEMETIYQICNKKPILLLDDVLSELDIEKREILTRYLFNNMQTFITATDVDYLDENILQKAQIFKIGE